MLAGKENIDDFFRDKQQSLPVDPAQMLQGWKDMDALLGKPVPAPKRMKRITRRLITYMGLIAVVTTVTYFYVSKSKGRVAAKKPVAQKIRAIAPAKSNTINLHAPSSKTAIVKNNISKKKQHAPAGFITKTRSVADTVFLQPAVDAMQPVGGSAIHDFYSALQQPEQVFEISAERDTLLFGNEGTVIKIPAGSFSNGRKAATGLIKISLVECYEYADMLAHNLVTTSGNEPLVTGGMIKLTATTNGQELKIFYNNPLSVAMPMDRYDPEMQLFLPSAKLVFNTPAEKKKAGNPVAALHQLADTIPGINAIPMAGENSMNGNLTMQMDWTPAGQQQAYRSYQKYNARKQVKLFDIQQKIKGINDGDEGRFIVNAGNHLSDEKIKELLAYRYSAAGYKKISIERRKSFTGIAKARQTNVSLTSDGFMATDSLMTGFDKANKEKLISMEDSLRFLMQTRMDSIAFFEKIKSDSMAYVHRIELEKAYRFDITQLGWINCDKLMNTGQPMVEFSIPIDPSIPSTFSRYQLVFINRKAVLPGSYANGLVNFGKLPTGEPVQVVCITEKDGKVFGCIQKTITGAAAMAALKFEAITPEGFKQKLIKL